MQQPEHIGTKEAADYLGVSTKTIDRMVASGALESYKVGRLRRFDRSALDAYLDRQRKAAAEERARRMPQHHHDA
jgi:excisionase family DNA binding protein